MCKSTTCAIDGSCPADAPASTKGRTSRRKLLQAGAGAAGLALLSSVNVAPAFAEATRAGSRSRTTLRLLGTGGGPVPWTAPHGKGRSGIASALTIGENTYLVDAGHGTFGRMDEAGIGAGSLRGIFITHLHSDHIAELFQLPWLRHGGIEPMRGPIQIYGPGPAGALPPAYPQGRQVSTINPENPTPGITDFFDMSTKAAAYDLNIRMRDEAWPDIRSIIQTHDITIPANGSHAVHNPYPRMDPFTVMENDDMKVTAILVEHPPVYPAFAFRFDTEDGSVVFSGDTTANENLVRLAKDADILVHEVIALDWIASLNVPDSLLNHLAASHTDVDTVGALAEQAGVRTLVLNHLVPGDPAAVKDSTWKKRAQKGFTGRVIVGNDLTELGLEKRAERR